MSAEEQLEWHLGITVARHFLREHRFHPVRRWRFDFAWPERMLAAEVEGMSSTGKSRHTTIKGYSEDCVKYNAAVMAGWRVLRFPQRAVERGDAKLLIVQAWELFDGRSKDDYAA